jgi:hypothetical protein
MLNRSDRNCLLGHGKHFVGKIDGKAAKVKMMIFVRVLIVVYLIPHNTKCTVIYNVRYVICRMLLKL